MKLGLLGPHEGEIATLVRAARTLVEVAHVDRAIYLGEDDALERGLAQWTKELVGRDPSDDDLWKVAAELAVTGAPTEIDRFVESERARLRLQVFQTLPGDHARTIEMVSDRVAVLVHEKALLDEEDIYLASFILYGRSDEPVIKRIGARWFITPGKIGTTSGGVCVLDDGGEDVTVTLYDPTGKASHHEALTLTRSTKMRVQGGP
jgi:hypothetical protein